MNHQIDIYLSDFLKNENGVSDSAISQLMQSIDFELPSDYISIMKEFNGGEGEIGPNSWLCMFPLEDLIQVNQDYSILLQQIPEYFIFGKDAADTGFAFNKKTKNIHSFGLMSDFKHDPIEFCGSSFLDFLAKLYNE